MRRLLVAAAVAAAAVFAATQVVGADDPGPTDVDVGFLQDMIDHHEQANLLASIALEGSTTPQVRRVALDVIGAQRYEIGLMEGRLVGWGLQRGDGHRRAMAWMGMDVAPATMPGMATTDDLADLGRLRGSALDRRFLELLVEHHEGGVHMAEAAADDAADDHVRWLAGLMARNQRQEIREIRTLLG